MDMTPILSRLARMSIGSSSRSPPSPPKCRATSTLLAGGSFPTQQSSILMRPSPQPNKFKLVSLSPLFNNLRVRCSTYGNEYRPSNMKRKRRHGFLKRLRTLNGRKMLKRRMLKGRIWLSH